MGGSTRVSFAAAGSSNSKRSNMNLNVGGGSKKQGLVSVIGYDTTWANRALKINAVGTFVGRHTIFTINQLGGVGVGRTMFNTASSYARPDGVRKRAPYLML